MLRKTIIFVALILVIGCSPKNVCKNQSVEAQLKEYIGIKLWIEANPVEYYVINIKNKFSNQQEEIKQKAKPYMDVLKLKDAKQVEKEKEYKICNGLIENTQNKFLVKYYVEEYNVGGERQYKVKVLDIHKIPK